MFCVVGSGPAGVACARALLDAGATVTMLDAGLELEPDREARLAALTAVSSEDWTHSDLAFMRDGVAVRPGGIPLKLAYGSDFPYREPASLPIDAAGADAKPSYAKGGLSNVWGASMLPFRDEDMEGWPITSGDLAPHYRKVLSFVPLAGRRDGLEETHPLYHDHPVELQPSSQAAALLADLDASRQSLLEDGIRFGASRLAIQAQSGGGPGCVRCAQCLYGCPFGYIYSSNHTLEALRENERFTYRPGVLVERLTESSGGVEISGRGIDGGEPVRLRADSAFVAAGVFSTARVMLASLEAFDRPLRAADNCYFLLPLLRYRGRKEVSRERLHTLAQVFIELGDAAAGRHAVHLQVYTYNDLLREQVRNMLGPADRVLGAAAERAVLARMLLIQGYLHSEVSPGLEVSLGRDGRLHVAATSNPKTGASLAAVQRRLWAERSHLRAVPLPAAMRVGRPGRGYHTGGTFPMREQPSAMETDTLGRPHGMSRIHIVDASVFPSLPATTITLSVMANAHRIGAAAAS